LRKRGQKNKMVEREYDYFVVVEIVVLFKLKKFRKKTKKLIK